MTIKHMLNPSTGGLENMTQRVCPVCSGHGRTIHDPDTCYLCNGYGTVWNNKNSGLTAALYARRTVFY